MKVQTRWLIYLLCWLLAAPALAETPKPSKQIWLLVDTDKQTLAIIKGQKTIKTYEDISIGRSGTTKTKHTKDGKTPLGDFRVSHITDKSSFHLFIGLDYPNLNQAISGLEKGLITKKQFDQIHLALRTHKLPPQNTLLGGRIGIHGLGQSSKSVHAQFNWTQGCVALTNEQVNDLAQWIQVGTRVIIK